MAKYDLTKMAAAIDQACAAAYAADPGKDCLPCCMDHARIDAKGFSEKSFETLKTLVKDSNSIYLGTYGGRYIAICATRGQGYRRETMAIAAFAKLQELGIKSSLYQMLD
jgi:hypothetical protein